MFKTLRGKLLFSIISSVIVINTIFTISVVIFLDRSFKKDITNEMAKNKNIALSTIKQNKVMEKPIWKSLEKINEVSDAYVSIVDGERSNKQYIGIELDKEEITTILKESKNISSLIKLKKIKDTYCVTFNYPVYINDEFYGNIVMQKDYMDKYLVNIKLITLISVGQAFAIMAIIVVATFFTKKITNPLRTLSISMEAFSKGKEVEDIKLKTNDEVEDVATAYNIMKKEIREQMDIIVQEKDKVYKLQKSSKEFFNNATHELKTPVAAISVYAELLKDNEIKNIDNEFGNRATERMILECDKLKTLIEKTLEVSSCEIKINKTRSEFSLNNLVGEIIEDFEMRIQNRKLNVIKDIDEVSCYGVLQDIDQIIVNLLDNSIKYSTGGDIEVKLKEKGEKILLNIKNNCGNIANDLKDRLMEPFIKYNSFDDISKEVSSSGLGLYLCSELAKVNHGSLSYEIKEDMKESVTYFSIKLSLPK